jgi:hypothetical protein
MDFDMKKPMTVKNRSSSMVVYRIPEHNIRREFRPTEKKVVPYEELVWLTYQPGGRMLMENFLQIESVEATENLSLHTEPEYFMNENQVIALLQTGTMDEFLDALDFAPQGVKDLIRHYAVSLPLNDSAKRRALKDKTGFDVDAAIANSEPDPEEAAKAEAPAATRRTQQKTEVPEVPTRRTEGSKYKIVSQEN